MRVLAIMGSPRRNGSGAQAVREIEARLRAEGDVELDVLHLADVDLQMCRGCFSCVRNGEGTCPLRDDRARIEERIEAADGIILVSPGYVQSVSGLMKNFMDRMAYTNHRPRFFGKKLMLVANGGAGLKRTLATMRNAIGGPEVVAELAYTSPPWPISPAQEAKRSRKLAAEVSRFRRSIQERNMAPSFGNYMRFRFFQATSASTAEFLPADHAYYQGRKGYYYDVRIGLGHRLGAAVLLRLGLFMMRGMAPYTGREGAE